MRPAFVSTLACPAGHGPLRLVSDAQDAEGNVETGRLLCGSCAPVEIRGGVPRFVDAGGTGSSADAAQVRESFSFKWTRLPRFGFASAEMRTFYDDWFAAKIGLAGGDALATYLKTKRRFLDAGTGLGAKVETFCRLNPDGDAVGADVSDSVGPAHENTRAFPNAHIVQADIMRLPLPPAAFDLIVSDGVLHHTPDARAAFEALLLHLAPGGEIAIHVYRRLGPIREFCDDLLRAHATRLSPEECWAFSEAITRFGESVGRLGATIEVPEDLPVLGIKAGKYDLQRFLYYNVFKCFWNAGFAFDENTLVNFDWYHPACATRHDEDEVVGWFADAGLVDVRSPRANENGVSVVGRRPAS